MNKIITSLTILMAFSMTASATLALTYESSEVSLGRFCITNKGTEPVTIKALQVEIVSQDMHGDQFQICTQAKPTDLLSKICGKISSLLQYRTTLAPGQSISFQLMFAKTIDPKDVSISIIDTTELRKKLCCI